MLETDLTPTIKQRKSVSSLCKIWGIHADELRKKPQGPSNYWFEVQTGNWGVTNSHSEITILILGWGKLGVAKKP